MVIQMPFYVDNLETHDGVRAEYLGDNLYHLPLEYLQSNSGSIVINLKSGITRGDSNNTEVRVIMQQYGIEIIYPAADFVQVNLYTE